MSRGKRDEKTVTDVFDSIFDQTDFVNAAGVASVVELPIESLSVSPFQPRKHFGAEELDQLAASIAAHGILQPVVVRQTSMGSYEIVVGERRFRAAKLIQRETIPAIVRNLDDRTMHLMALVENLQRTDLNPLEETDALLRLLSATLDKPLDEVVETLTTLNDEARGRTKQNIVTSQERRTIERLFQEIGRFSVRSFVSHRLPLLNLPDDLLETVRSGRLSYTKATAVARLKDAQARATLVRQILEENLSLREVQARVAAGKGETAKSRVTVAHELTSHYTALGKRLKQSPALQDERKRKRIHKLLEQLDKLLS